MTNLSSTALAVMRRRCGDLTDDILVLRNAGRTVRPEGAFFAVDRQIVNAAGVEQLANELRARQAAKRTTETAAGHRRGGDEGTAEITSGPGIISANPFDEPRSPAIPASDSAVSCSSQNPRQVTEPVEPKGNSGWAGERGTVHESCGGVESRHAGPKWRTPLVLPSEGLQAGSPPGEPGSVEGRADKQPRAGVAPGPQDTTAEQRIAALEADLATLKDNLADALRELLARIEAGEGR